MEEWREGWGKRSRSSLPHIWWPSVPYFVNLKGKKGFILQGFTGEATSHHITASFYVKPRVSAGMFHTCSESHRCPNTGRVSREGRGGGEGNFGGPGEHQVHGWGHPPVFSSVLSLLLTLFFRSRHIQLQPRKDPSSGQMSRASQPDPRLCWTGSMLAPGQVC